MTEVTPIPRPRPLPVLGNALEVHVDTRFEDMMRLAREYWPVFELSAFGHRVVVVSGDELIEELCDERRFAKLVGPTLQAVRPISGNGLFTADTDDPVWRQAHHILMPAFSPTAIRAMVPTMGDPLSQFLLKWARLNPGEVVEVARDTTSLTLETIGLCAFGYRFNSFYREEPHPFVRAMAVSAHEAQRLLHRPDAVNKLDRVHQRRYQQAAGSMHELVDTLIRTRREAGSSPEPRDLLDYMLAGVDPETGQGLSDENIRYQIVTFLVAGHETTGGLLTFALYELAKNPEVLARAREEVDRALGDDLSSVPGADDLGKLGYVEQILKESLRLWPTAPAFFLHPFEPTTLGGRYQVDVDTQIMVFSPMHHRDPSVWGETAERFDPNHFTAENEAALPPNAWKPFGNGIRACIGRHFAMVEATLALAAILQRFELVDHANYTLKVRWPATMRPAGFTLQVRPREGRAASVMASLRAAEDGQAAVEAPAPGAAAAGRLSLVVGVVEGPARSGHGTYRGTCSSFLAAQPPGAMLFGFVRRPGIPFWPPDDPAVPMIMIATGTGLAPFRGFLQRRRAQGSGRGPAILFFGCRDTDHRLFSDELDRFADAGVATIDTAYSDQNGQPRVFVQDRISERADELWPLVEAGAVVYVCGHAAHVAPAVRQTSMDVFRQRTGAGEEEAEAWLQELRSNNRYLEDIWAAA